MTARRRIAALAALSVLTAGAVGSAVLVSLYRAALSREGAALLEVVQSQARLAESVFQHELDSHHAGDSARARNGVLAQLTDAHQFFRGFGGTGEFTVTRVRGDTLYFEVGLRWDSVRVPDPIPLPSPLGEPAQRAARGDTGVVRALDYRGVSVLAAHTPIAGTDLGLVAKMDLSEVRAPYLRAALQAALIIGLLLVVALFLALPLGRLLLREVEERESAHRAVLEHFPGIAFRAVPDGGAGWRFDVFEGSAEEISGYPAEHFRGPAAALGALVPEEDRASFEERWRGHASGEITESRVEHRICRRDGSMRWVRAIARSEPGEVGERAVNGVIYDITDERHAREVRQRAEEQLSALVRHLPGAAVHVMSHDFRYLHSGGEGLAKVGLSHEALVGRHLLDVLGPELGSFMMDEYRRVLDGETRRFERHFGGVDFSVTAVPLASESGVVERILVLSMDVTEQRRRDEELASTEARFRAFMDASPAVAWVKDAEGRYLWVNPAWEKAFALPGGGWHGKTDQDLISGPLAEAARRTDEEVLRTGQALTVVEDTGGPEGERRIWQTSRFPLLGASREALVGGVAVDITRERGAEAARQESEHRLRVAVKAGGHGLWDLDLRTGVAQVDELYAGMLGYDPAGFVETNAAWRDRLHPDDRAAVYGAYEAYVAGERDVYRVEFRSRTAEGGWRWLLSQGEVVERDAEGRPLRMMGTHTDIQALKDAEAALRESEDRFRRAVEASPVAIFIHTAGRFAYLNPAALALFGASRPEQLLGQPVLERHVAADRSEVAARIRTISEKREPTPVRVEGVLRLDETEARAEFTGVPFRYMGQDAGLVFAHDVTERLASEELIRTQMDELRRWQAVMLDREDRVQELKREVNDLCRLAGSEIRYPSQEGEPVGGGRP
jgi:PAS domain S-box-containing protein